MNTNVSESNIQSAILDYLLMKKHFVIRLNNIPPTQMVNGSRVFRRMPKGSVKGLPDIAVVTEGGYVVWLEVKKVGGRLSPDQIEFKRRVDEKCGEYYVVRSIEDLIQIGL